MENTPMKNGLIFENEELIYYKNGKPYHAGAIKVDDCIYYISSNGKAVKGQHIVHREMTNHILERGTYTFGEDYKLVPGSFIAPKKKKRRKKKLSKKQQKTISLVVTGVLILLVGVLMTTNLQPPAAKKYKEKQNQSADQSQEATTEPTQTVVLLEIPEIKQPLLTSGAAQLLYQGKLSATDAAAEGDPYRALIFNYKLIGADATLYISEYANFYKATKYTLPKNQSSILIDNLKTGNKYYWKAVAGEEVHLGEFTTAKTTRFVKIEGAKNTRDIGGYVNQDGKTIKQGMIIRGTEIDALEAVGSNYFLPAEAVEGVQKTFGFVYDMDLRYSNVYTGNTPYQSRLGENVRHKFYSAPQYGQIFHTTYEASLRNIFADLANPDNYPMYLHCAYGADRTGTITFLLMGVLNMSEEEMMREYWRTGFTSSTYTDSTKMNVVIEGLQSYEGDTIQEKIVSFLLSKGVTQQQLDSIREILLTD